MSSRPARTRDRIRLVANLANLSTPLGLAVARLGRASLRRGPRGLWLAEGYRFSFPVAGAFTIGDVIITGSTFAERTRQCPGLLEHEERHSWQWLVCGGLPFLPLYAVAMAWSWIRSGDRARRNVFERHAGLALGGYL